MMCCEHLWPLACVNIQSFYTGVFSFACTVFSFYVSNSALDANHGTYCTTHHLHNLLIVQQNNMACTCRDAIGSHSSLGYHLVLWVFFESMTRICLALFSLRRSGCGGHRRRHHHHHHNHHHHHHHHHPCCHLICWLWCMNVCPASHHIYQFAEWCATRAPCFLTFFWSILPRSYSCHFDSSRAGQADWVLCSGRKPEAQCVRPLLLTAL